MSRHHFAAIRHVGGLTLLANASVAFFLNLGTMALIKQTSALTLNISGVFKDLFLIFYSVVVSGAVVTPLQYGGYSIALAGVVAYTRYKTAKSAAVPTAAARKVAGDVVPKDVSAASEEEAAPLAYEDGRERTPNDEDGEH